MDIDEVSRDDLELVISTRFPQSAIEASGRLTLERETMAHLGFQNDEQGEVNVVCRSDTIEIWAASTLSRHLKRVDRFLPI